jgi:hypothetical protein
MYKYFKDLPPWAKGVVVVGTGAALYFAGLSLYRNIRRNKDIKEANKAGEAAQKELGELASKGINPTLPDSQFQALSESLVQAMNGCGTDEEMVYSVFRKIKNDADIRKLIAVFGVRYYQPCAADQPISYTKWLINEKSYGGGLPTWLSYDLSASEIDKINSILKTNGVNYSF